jgi:predicted DNA-binding transcriptional regulator YafY
MPTTTQQNRDERLQIIDKCLQNSHTQWTVKLLQEKVNSFLTDNYFNTVSSRTIADDLKYLEFKKAAPIKKIQEGRKVFYHYEEPFELYKPIVSTDDSFNMAIAQHLLQQISGFTVGKELQKTFTKLQQQIEDSANTQIIFFEDEPLLKNIHLLQDIFECIYAKTVLEIEYQHFKATESAKKIIHPYFLKQYNKRWFLFGFDELLHRIDNSAIDRIVGIKPLQKIQYKANIVVNPSTYFNSLIGVTKPQDALIEIVEFSITKQRANYLLTKPMHKSQQIIKEESDTITFTITVIINNELIALLLSYGSDITITQPIHLKNTIANIVENTAIKYNHNE